MTKSNKNPTPASCHAQVKKCHYYFKMLFSSYSLFLFMSNIIPVTQVYIEKAEFFMTKGSKFLLCIILQEFFSTGTYFC